MRAKSIKVHNFRSFLDGEFNFNPFSILVGANNTGKSNLIDAIRIFYEKEIKFDEVRDFPKFQTIDKESWIEIQFEPTPDEFVQLKNEYQLSDGTFRVRKYLKSGESDDEGKPKNGIYAYINGTLSNTRFYGAKNVQQAKFGEIIYIPAVSKLDEHTKLTGPSALRDLINNVLKNVIENSSAYSSLKSAFDGFGAAFKTEATPDGQSLQQLESEISSEISQWGTSFELFVSPTSPDDLVKSLIGLRLRDNILNECLDPKMYGQGFQRNLIFTLIKLASRTNYSLNNSQSKKEFSPRLTWILFEEPEAFLHPNQIEVLNNSMHNIASDDVNQILISTHNPQFVSKNIEDLTSMARLYKSGPYSKVKQLSSSALQSIIKSNQQDLKIWQDAGISISSDDFLIEMESIKYALWLNPYRCCALFSNKVLLVEGPTEVAIIGYLINKGEIKSEKCDFFIFDAMGKYNIHRFMNLFGELGIYHSVLYDHDGGNDKAKIIESTILSSQNPFTMKIDYFDYDIEKYLGIKSPDKPHRKPQHVMHHVTQGKIEQDRLNGLSVKVQDLLDV